jgi:5-methylcytosine-specific restriction endonuclease McrA
MISNCQNCNVSMKCRRKSKKWCDDCRVIKDAESRRRYHDRNPEMASKWEKAHPGLKYAAEKRRREQSPEASAKYREQLRATNARRLAAKNAWDRAHPLEARMRVEKRRALLAQAKGTFNATDWSELCEWTDQRCFYCGQQKKLEQDHLIPLSRGGAHDRTNIVPACRSCNSRKRDKTYDEFVAIYVLEVSQ